MSGLEFRIRFPDGRVEQLLVDSEQVLIGSGAHCEIRLPTEHAAVEHVIILNPGGAVHAQARALDPPPTINGSPFTQAPLLPDSVLALGGVQIEVRAVEIADDANVIRKKQEKTSPLVYVLALVGLPAALFLLLDEEVDDGTSLIPTEAPALFPEQVDRCPQSAADQALGYARDRKLAAEGKRERSPFEVRDGVAAVPLFEQAAACFRIAKDAATAAEMAAAAAKLKTALTDDYRAHQMRLEHAIEVRDLSTAQKEVRVLLAMLEGQTGEYVVSLSNLDRRLTLRLGKKPE